ncbi:MAG TPA: hypothetical protein VLL97_07565, partial [Acidobacteriota bacterium]|nr:hypothetical protein [Acidobacteriota bacterium]
MKKSDVSAGSRRDKFIKGILAGDFRLLARLLTMVENGDREAMPYLRELFAHTGKGFSAGITGAPGSGKSTLTDRLAQAFRQEQKKV